MNIIARCYMGARDLYFGMPDLTNATLISVNPIENKDDYETVITLCDKVGRTHTITIVQDK